VEIGRNQGRENRKGERIQKNRVSSEEQRKRERIGSNQREIEEREVLNSVYYSAICPSSKI